MLVSVRDLTKLRATSKENAHLDQHLLRQMYMKGGYNAYGVKYFNFTVAEYALLCSKAVDLDF